MDAVAIAGSHVNMLQQHFRIYSVSSYAQYSDCEIVEHERQLAQAAAAWIQIGDPRSEQIIARAPEHCQIVRVPPCNLPIFWPYGEPEPLNVQEADYPYGRYPYGDAIIKRMSSDPGVSDRNAMLVYNENLWQRRSEIKDKVARFLQIQEARDAGSSIKLAPFINALASRCKSHFTYNHPTASILCHLFERLCSITHCIEADAANLALAGKSYFDVVEPFSSISIPIADPIYDIVGLKWGMTHETCSYYGKEVTFEEYIVDYLQFRRERSGPIPAA